MNCSDKAFYACPKCRNEIQSLETFKCSHCDYTWSIYDGVPVLLVHEVDYWNELPLDEMTALNKKIVKSRWKEVVENDVDQRFHKVIFGAGRADWRYTAGIDDNSSVLDIGCGWGNLSFALAKTARQVVAYEPVKERIKFVDTRIKQDSVNNMQALCGDALHLPFSDQSFDVVIFNGVLEWVGYTTQELSAQECQEKALKEAYRVLKPGGRLYLAIENASSLIYFAGAKDPHSGLRFVTFMPRFIANGISQIFNKRPYRTYIYTYNGYKKILSSCGFKNEVFYAPLATYRDFKHLLPIDDVNKIRYWFNNLFQSKLEGLKGKKKLIAQLAGLFINSPFARMFKYLVPDYSIVATKDSSQLELSLPSEFNADSMLYCKGWRKKNIFIFKENMGEPDYLCRIASDEIGLERLIVESKVLSAIANDRDDNLKGTVPELLYAKEFNGEFLMVEKIGKGYSLLKLIHGDNYFATVGRLFSETVLAPLNSDKKIDQNAFVKLVVDLAKSKCQQESILSLIEQFIATHTVVSKDEDTLNCVLMHNDLHPENVITDENSNLVIFDWEYAQLDGYPLIDIINILFHSCLSLLKLELSLESFVAIFYEKHNYSEFLTDLLSEYVSKSKLSSTWVQLLLLYYVINFIKLENESLVKHICLNKAMFLQN